MLFTDAVKGKTFKCDDCKKTFLGETIKLKTSSKNISMISMMNSFKFVDKDGKIMGGSKGPDGNIGDQVAHCPLCDFPHLSGIDQI